MPRWLRRFANWYSSFSFRKFFSNLFKSKPITVMGEEARPQEVQKAKEVKKIKAKTKDKILERAPDVAPPIPPKDVVIAPTPPKPTLDDRRARLNGLITQVQQQKLKELRIIEESMKGNILITRKKLSDFQRKIKYFEDEINFAIEDVRGELATTKDLAQLEEFSEQLTKIIAGERFPTEKRLTSSLVSLKEHLREVKDIVREANKDLASADLASLDDAGEKKVITRAYLDSLDDNSKKEIITRAYNENNREVFRTLLPSVKIALVEDFLLKSLRESKDQLFEECLKRPKIKKLIPVITASYEMGQTGKLHRLLDLVETKSPLTKEYSSYRSALEAVLDKAIEKIDFDMIGQIIDRGCEISNKKMQDIIEAVAFNMPNKLEELLSQKFIQKFKEKDRVLAQVLESAIGQSNTGVVNKILEFGNIKSVSILLDVAKNAAYKGEKGIMDIVITKIPHHELTNDLYQIICSQAVSRGNKAIYEPLINEGKFTNIRHLISTAVSSNKMDSIGFLLTKITDLEERNNLCKSFVSSCIDRDDFVMASGFLSKISEGERANVTSSFQEAAKKGNMAAIDYMISEPKLETGIYQTMRIMVQIKKLKDDHYKIFDKLLGLNKLSEDQLSTMVMACLQHNNTRFFDKIIGAQIENPKIFEAGLMAAMEHNIDKFNALALSSENKIDKEMATRLSEAAKEKRIELIPEVLNMISLKSAGVERLDLAKMDRASPALTDSSTPLSARSSSPDSVGGGASSPGKKQPLAAAFKGKLSGFLRR